VTTPKKAALALAFASMLASSGRMAEAAGFFWESPAELPLGQARYPTLIAWKGAPILFWQESESSSGSGSAWVSFARREGSAWQARRRIAGPTGFSGEEPPLYSVASGDRLVVALSAFVPATEGEVADRTGVEIYSSSDGTSFEKTATISRPGGSVVAPRVYAFPGGGYALFTSQEGSTAGLGLGVATSPDGAAWTGLSPLLAESDGLELSSFQPAFIATSRARAIVVFQSLVIENRRSSFQLFAKSTTDGGLSWSPARRLTGFADPGAASGAVYDNQRPSLSLVGGTVYLAWERAQVGARPRAWIARVSSTLDLESPEAVSPGAGSAREPSAFDSGSGLAVVWFDNRSGNDAAYLATRSGPDWKEKALSRAQARFVRAIAYSGGVLAVWESGTGARARLVEIAPDVSVRAPVPRAVGFTEGRRTRSDRAGFGWNAPEDSSGLLGFSWLWSRDPEAEPAKTLSGGPLERSASFAADDDGDWYFSIRAADAAGNWSPTARVRFTRDTTPPAAPDIGPAPLDPSLALASNTFDLSWDSPGSLDASGAQDTIVGYSWTLRRIAPPFAARVEAGLAADERAARVAQAWLVYAAGLEGAIALVRPPGTSWDARKRAAWTNIDDGVWVFAVAAVDEAGNVGESARLVLRAERFIPYTSVSMIERSMDDANRLTLRISGRGYLTGGTVVQIALDRDGKEPWDRAIEAGRFRIESDVRIVEAAFEDVETGEYRLALRHSGRGWYLAPGRLSLVEGGAIKYGDYSTPFAPAWAAAKGRAGASGLGGALAWALASLAAIGVLASGRALAYYAGEGTRIRRDAIALVNGEALTVSDKKARATAIKRRGAGLRVKFSLTFIMLVLFVVLVVAIPLGVFAIDNQGSALAHGLEERANIVLESASIVTGNFLSVNDELGLLEVPSQTRSMADALWMTVTSFEKDGEAAGFDWVRGSNDPDLASKTGEQGIRSGKTKLVDGISPSVDSIAADIEKEADARVGELNRQLSSIRDQVRELATKSDEQSLAKLAELSSTSRSYTEEINARLREIADESVLSFPAYDPSVIPAEPVEYVFFKPVLYRRADDSAYFRGAVRLSVSTASIVDALAESRRTIIGFTALFAVGAVVLGAVIALILSSIIVTPIKRLAIGIGKIRDTEDKSTLIDYGIEVKTHDEIRTLADTVNEMTHGLAKAAQASKDLTLGKETQKMFIPLEQDSHGNKLTTGSFAGPGFRIFGYYEGAKGVSGDYFDFERLDQKGRYHAFIKCDVAGKGVPAALIMVEVATLFLSHFKDWDSRRTDFALAPLAFQINDMLEGRGFKGRFAALLLGVFDSATGKAVVCNAGDKFVNVYRSATGTLELIELPDAPTAGTFPSFMVEMKTPFKEVPIQLERGDIMLLYTDGIEEAKRYFRDASFQVVPCSEGEKDGEPHGNHSRGQDNEEFGRDRVKAIVEAVIAKKSFTLRKYHDPENVRLEFDFSGLDGTVDDVVMAMVSVEKMYRRYRAPDTPRDNLVIVDRKIDAFLAKTLAQYRPLLGEPLPNPDSGRPEYVAYAGNAEDEQYDDLTILGIARE
jgi:hypothetical protein